MPTRFDYKAAHAAVADPIARALPQAALDIYRELRSSSEYEGLAQGANLDIPMPERLGRLFDLLDSETLALAARALYYFGHWNTGQALDPGKFDTRGAHWKFSNLADQVLRKRLGLRDRGNFKSIGYHFEVHEGALRLCASTPDTWTWIELGPATEEFLALARDWRATLTGCPADRYSRTSKRWQDFETAAWDATRQRPTSLETVLSDSWARLLRASDDFMVEEGKASDDCPECGKQRLFNSAAANHTLKCSQFPNESRVDALLRHADVYGFSPEQAARVREFALRVLSGTHPADPPRSAHEVLPGDSKLS